jgi:hypothetical protein
MSLGMRGAVFRKQHAGTAHQKRKASWTRRVQIRPLSELECRLHMPEMFYESNEASAGG